MRQITGRKHGNSRLARCCGACSHFEHEDAMGDGYCNMNDEPRNCASAACGKWKKMKELIEDFINRVKGGNKMKEYPLVELK